MCGISGIYSPSGSINGVISIVSNMLAKIEYRGPDECGIYTNDQVTLGSVRLSIIDVKTGQQPLSTPDGKYWIVFNGEIFNYIELRQSLLKAGHTFITESDTEVLLHTYMEYGPEGLNRLNGQFAVAIWNNEKRELFMARDRVGIRPLFYTWSGGHFVFGSEIKTLFEHPDTRAEIDPLALSQIFTFWTTITPRTIFKNILEVPPGHYLTLSGTELKIRKFWSLQFPVDDSEIYKGSIKDASMHLEHLLEDAVRIRLRADVPVAAYLSGGLDSSATTELIKKIAPSDLQTFSIGFEDAEFDESGYQKEVSDYLNTKHTAFTCNREEIGNCFPAVVWHSEIPLLRTAPVPMYCLSKKVRENNIKVVITGEGADEMLAGYDIFKEGIIREFWSRQPESRLRPLLFQKLYPYIAQFHGRNKNALKFFFGYKLLETESPFYSHLLRWHNTSNLCNYFSEELKSLVAVNEGFDEVMQVLPSEFNKYSRLGKSQWLESVIFMSGYLLSSQGDRMGMANSVEGRYPFLDYRVMEFAAKLPPGFKMHGLNEKYILKQIMKDRLPLSVLKRPKQAYRSPISGSLFSNTAKNYTEDLLSEHEIKRTGLFNALKVNGLVEKIKSSEIQTENDNMALCGILSMQILYHQYIFKDSFRPSGNKLTNLRIFRETNPMYT
ncbi:MAG TPA: asparagine synthase (glutamine-hydrolyzing) [Bacteroidales bacterium]|nr:asparagine synthase (glutamine-hydrolyzing) [Bacteroidales bacterium]